MRHEPSKLSSTPAMIGKTDTTALPLASPDLDLLPGLDRSNVRPAERPCDETQNGVPALDLGPAPDGGLRAWTCIAGAFCTMFCILGFNVSFGQLQVYYMTHQLKDYTQAEVGWIASIAIFIASTGSLFSGRYFDSHGARNLLIAGTLLYVGSLVGLAFSTTYVHLFLSHTGIGVAGALVFAPATAIAGHWFVTRRSTAVGIIICGSGVAGIVYPVMIRRLIAELDFRRAMLIVAGMNSALMCFACSTMRTRLPPRSPPPWSSLLGPWSDPRYSCLVIGCALYMMNSVAPYFNAYIYAQTNRTSQGVQDYAVFILQVGSFCGRLSSGFIADKVGVWNTFVFMGLLSAVSLLGLWTPASLRDVPVVIGLLIYGYGQGAWQTLLAASCAAISPVTEIGMRLGMIWTLCGPPGLVGPVIFGALITADGGRVGYAAIYTGITNAIGSLITIGPPIMYLVMRRMGSRTKETSVELGPSARTIDVEVK